MINLDGKTNQSQNDLSTDGTQGLSRLLGPDQTATGRVVVASPIRHGTITMASTCFCTSMPRLSLHCCKVISHPGGRIPMPTNQSGDDARYESWIHNPRRHRFPPSTDGKRKARPRKTKRDVRLRVSKQTWINVGASSTLHCTLKPRPPNPCHLQKQTEVWMHGINVYGPA